MPSQTSSVTSKPLEGRAYAFVSTAFSKQHRPKGESFLKWCYCLFMDIGLCSYFIIWLHICQSGWRKMRQWGPCTQPFPKTKHHKNPKVKDASMHYLPLLQAWMRRWGREGRATWARGAALLNLPFSFFSLHTAPQNSTSHCTGDICVSFCEENFLNAVCKVRWPLKAIW